MRMHFETVCTALGAKKVGGEWLALCPVHNDHNPSLSIAHGSKQDVLFTCRAGCPQKTVLEAVKARVNGNAARELRKTETKHEFKYTLEQLEQAEAQLDKAAAFLAGRGISLETARVLRFGFENGWLVMPYFLEGELVAVKLRAINPKACAHKWLKHNRDKSVFHLFNRDAGIFADDLYVVESELDAAMLTSMGLSAVSVDSAGHKLTREDAELLKRVGRVILALDTDEEGQACAAHIEAVIPESRRLRIIPQSVKDLGELYAEAPKKFVARLAKIVRFAETMRAAFTWDDLLTESEIIDRQGPELRYAVDKLIPLQRITLFYGLEKSCKSLLALYVGKCVANGKRVLDSFAVQQMPCLYLDAEEGILGEYLGWLQPIGPEQVRFRTLQTSIPALDDPALLNICREKRPLLIVDSLHKFFGRESEKLNVWRASDVEPVLERLRRLAVAGATIILIHHAIKSDPEQYRDSGAIGAGVDFLFAVVGEEPVNGVTRVRMIGRPSRGAQPPSLNLIAFPHLIDMGKFTLDGDPPKSDVDRVVEFVCGAGKANERAVRAGVKGISNTKKDAALAEALERGLLVLDSKGFYSAPGCGGAPGALIAPRSGRSAGTFDYEYPF